MIAVNSNIDASYETEPLVNFGIGCGFPGRAESPGSYWDVLVTGAGAIRGVPEDRWNPNKFIYRNKCKPNSKTDFAGGLLNIPVDLSQFPSPENEAVLGSVKSFGYGGANGHAILEQCNGVAFSKNCDRDTPANIRDVQARMLKVKLMN